MTDGKSAFSTRNKSIFQPIIFDLRLRCYFDLTSPGTYTRTSIRTVNCAQVSTEKKGVQGTLKKLLVHLP